MGISQDVIRRTREFLLEKIRQLDREKAEALADLVYLATQCRHPLVMSQGYCPDCGRQT